MLVIAKRIFLFLIVNLLIIITISLTLNILGFKGYITVFGIDYTSLLIFCLVWGMLGSFISLWLSRIMAKMMMGVKVIDPNTTDTTLRWLVDTVYKIAKQAGLSKMPEVGIYISPEVNAFATGPTRNRSLVALSSGLLETMDEEEIEGVIGHEISHIANGDMVTMTLLQGVINAIVMFLARIIAFVITSKRDREESSWGLRYLITVVLEVLLSFLGMIVLAAFSRFREFKADHQSALLCGKDKMIKALEKLRRTVSKADLTKVESIRAFKISSNSVFLKLFATHPPLDERIKRLEEMY